MKPTFSFLVAGLLVVAGTQASESPRGYYRSPALHGETVVFTAEGDLWRTTVAGGLARRLTSHPGEEIGAAIAPDGTQVAFTAHYEGPREVYVMPIAGGAPIRLTHDDALPRVAGWTPRGEVLFRTDHESTLPGTQLVAIDPETRVRRTLPLAEASEGIFETDGRTLYFTRLNAQRSSTKRYRGGWIENLWRFTEGTPEAIPLTTDFPGTSRNPMLWQGRIYFLSDRDGIMNLWSIRPNGSDPSPVTRHRDFDIQCASLHNGRLVYQRAGDLHLLDLERGNDAVLQIRLSSDLDQQRERWVKKPHDYLTAASLSPTGDRLVLTARGQVFVAPTESGRLVELARPPGTRYRAATFLPDGRSLLALSDQTGEFEFWKLPANGLGPASQITSNATVFRFPGVPSPDGRWIASTDKNLRLWIHHLASGAGTLVEQSRNQGFEDLVWSPDSQWLAFVASASNQISRIHLYRPEDQQRLTATSDRVDSFSPAWSTDGQWLYFLSDRELRSLVPNPWGPRQPDPYFAETTRIYALALNRGQRWPFAPRDELDLAAAPAKSTADTPSAPQPAPGTENPSAAVKKPVPSNIEPDGLPTRIHTVPLDAGNHRDLLVTPKKLFWIQRDTGFGSKNNLRELEIHARSPKPRTLAEDVDSAALSGDGSKLLIRKRDAFYVIPVDTAAPAKLDTPVPLGDWSFSIHPREEWRQIYTEAWRMLRDYFYDRGMHGTDWPAVHRKYLPLVDRVTDRAELSDVLHSMAGELSALHIYVMAGDERTGPDNIRVASLGARFEREAPGGSWRIRRLYRADPDQPGESGPLTRPGIDLVPGDIIAAINGRPTASVADPEILLRHQTGRQVLLDVLPVTGPARQVIVTPISAEQEFQLRYGEWELTRRERVEALGRGRIGYVHLRAMGTDDIAQWARHYFPVFNRQGLIVDVRNNRGGNIDSWILGKLLRKAWFYWQPRAGDPTWNMHYAFRGHLVVLCNAKTASDGEAFAEGFRRLGLGKVIGTRTWGGEIWLSASRWLVDSGMTSAAEVGVYGPEGTWLIEGHGVDPDIVVDNLPHETFEGGDRQLDAAIRHLQELITADPRPVPPTPPYPDKSHRP